MESEKIILQRDFLVLLNKIFGETREFKVLVAFISNFPRFITNNKISNLIVCDRKTALGIIRGLQRRGVLDCFSQDMGSPHPCYRLKPEFFEKYFFIRSFFPSLSLLMPIQKKVNSVFEEREIKKVDVVSNGRYQRTI
jgi:hypothetical protein